MISPIVEPAVPDSLAQRVVRTHARCVRVVAGAGWGKTTFIRSLAAALAIPSAVIHCRGMASVRELDDALAAALRDLGVPGSPDDVFAGWRAAGGSCALIIDEGAVLLGIDRAIDRLRALLRATPEDRMIVVTSRAELPVVWSSYFAPHEMLTVTATDLAIDRSELALLLRETEHTPELDERILSVSQGWPIAVLLFIRLAALGTLESTLDALGKSAALVDLHAYVESEIFAGLGEAELETFCAICAIGGGTLDEIIIAVGRDVAADLARLSGPVCSLIAYQNGVYSTLPLARAAAEATQGARIREILREASERLSLAGRYVRAAELALLQSDSTFAVRCLDAVSEPVPNFVPSQAYLRAALRIDTLALMRSRNVLTILLAGRCGVDVAAELASKIETCWDNFSQKDEDNRLRATLRVARAYVLRSSGRYEAAVQSAKGAERDLAFLTPDSPIVRALYCIRAVLALDFLRIDEAAHYWELSGEPPAASATFFAVDRLEADLLTAYATTDVNEIARAFTATLAELDRWGGETGRLRVDLIAETAHFLQHGRLPETAVPPSLERAQLIGADSFIAAYDVSVARPPVDPAVEFAVFAKIDAALKQSDRSMAVELLRGAATLADRLGLPLHRVFARVVWSAIDEDRRPALIAEALAIAPIDALRARIADVRDDALEAPSIFEPALRNLHVTSLAGAPAFRVEIMRGLVFAHGAIVRLRDREHELLVSLALAPGGLSREALTDRLWPDQAEHDAAGSLRSTLHRLRQRFGDNSVVIRDGSQYRLSTDVSVDVVEAEALLNALRGKNVQPSGVERRSLEREFHGLAVTVPDAYVRWTWFADVERRIVDLRHDAGMLLAREDYQAGRFVAAQRWVERLVELEPLDEAAAELLLHAIIRTRGNTEAARWLRRYRDLLAREYGLEPSFEFDRAFESDAQQITA